MAEDRAERETQRDVCTWRQWERSGRVVACPLGCMVQVLSLVLVWFWSWLWLGAQRLIESSGCHWQSPAPTLTSCVCRRQVNEQT